MLVISLDEYGKFEGEIKKRCMVAGTVFQCADTRALLREQERIVDYLRDVCRRSGAEFPKDLHPQWENGKKEISNEPQLQRVQETLERTLARFFMGAEPQGRYYLYAMVAQPQGISAFNGEDVGNLLRDSFAGNRYLHMSQMVLRDLIVNNPVVQDQHYHLELATRAIGVDKLETDRKKQLQQQADMLGMQHVRREDGSRKEDYQLTDGNSYIAALSAMVMEEARKDIDFNLKVQSIKYEDDPSRTRIQSFMLLADMVCSALQPALLGDAQVTRRLLERANSFTTHTDNMIWCYHDVDLAMQKARKYLREGQWFACLQALHGVCGDGEQAQFYRDTWVQMLLQQMRSQRQSTLATDAARLLARQLERPDANMAQCRYIAETLCHIIEGADGRYSQCRYLLHSCLMTLCNHAGDHEQARCHYRCCEQYAAGVPLEEYLQLRNGYSVTLLDMQSYEEALENTQKTLQLAQLADRLRGEICGTQSTAGIHQGRTLSQLGQCFGFLERYQEAEEAFLQGLHCLRESPEDLQKTRSYLLHCYIEAGKRKAYEALAKEYFGVADFIKQLESCMTMEDTAGAYALLVCLKGWYRMPPNNVYPRQTEKLLEQVVEFGKEQTGHPWELIWKYTVLLAKKNKVKDQTITEHAQRQLRSMAQTARGQLQRVCEDALEGCTAGKETGSLTYMYR